MKIKITIKTAGYEWQHTGTWDQIAKTKNAIYVDVGDSSPARFDLAAIQKIVIEFIR